MLARRADPITPDQFQRFTSRIRSTVCPRGTREAGRRRRNSPAPYEYSDSRLREDLLCCAQATEDSKGGSGRRGGISVTNDRHDPCRGEGSHVRWDCLHWAFTSRAKRQGRFDRLLREDGAPDREELSHPRGGALLIVGSFESLTRRYHEGTGSNESRCRHIPSPNRGVEVGGRRVL